MYLATLIGAIVLTAAEFYLAWYVRRFWQRTDLKDHVKRLRRMNFLQLLLLLLAIPSISFPVWIDVHPFSHWFLLDILILLVVAGETYDAVTWFRCLRKPDNLVIGRYYRSRHFHLLASGDIMAAGEAIEEACRYDSQSLQAWLDRVYYAGRYLDKLDDAGEYLQTAERLLSEAPKRNMKNLATYEWYKGRHLIRLDEIEDGLIHMKRSLELHHDKERARIIKEIEYFRDKEREYD
jgi:hypothetical protein